MSTNNSLEDAIDVLQQLGLKEYEAKCFVGLSRLSTGTAKQLSEITEVPRTRIYDAIRVLEAQGLVEIQHSSPQRYRAVPLEEATETLRDQYGARIERLANALEETEKIQPDAENEIQEVWAMAGTDAVENRTHQLIQKATQEVVLVVGHQSLLTEELVDTLNHVPDDIKLLVGAVTESLQEQIREAVPNAETFISGLDWLRGESDEDDLTIGRLLLVDRSTILVSTIVPESGDEQAIFGEGFRNGLVVIARRLMAQGLVDVRDPEKNEL